MTDAVTILAQQRNRLHSQGLYMESIATNREDELSIWVLKADLACIVYYRSQADTAAEADDLRVISKEAVGNSWGILSLILITDLTENIQIEICNRKLSLITFVSFRMRMRH